MSDSTNWAERRQFGRRPLNADATAELGGVEVPCVIENLSEGGALLSFPSGVAPISLFDLAVDGSSFKLKCEMRYQVGVRFGVRFLHLSQGEALVRYFFPPSAEATPSSSTARKIVDRDPLPAVSVRHLRQALFPLVAPDVKGEPELAAEPASTPVPKPLAVACAADNERPGTAALPRDPTTASAAANPLARLLRRRRA